MGKYQPERVWLFAYAIRMALTPVILLPISYFVFHERVGWQAVFGTVPASRVLPSYFWHNWGSDVSYEQ